MTGAEALPYPPGQPWTVECAASQCARLARCVDELGEHLAGRTAGNVVWQGRAAVAHRTEVAEVAGRVPVLPRALALTARLVRTQAERLVQACRDVDGLRSRYDGLVDAFRRDTATRSGDPGPLGALRARDAERELSAALARLRARHRDVLHELAAAETTAAEQLRAAAHDLRPAVARSRVNEARLDRQVSALQGRRRVRTTAQQRRLDNCLVVRRLLRHVRGLRDPVTGAALTAQLLVFEPGRFDGEGRVAVAVGDVDTAGHLAVLVPGLGSAVGSELRSLTGDAVRVRGAARRQSTPVSGTAVVAWMGYDAPEPSNVASIDAARRGGELLVTDLQVFQAGRVVPPHLTVVGDSYGSTTAGMATRRQATGVDELVLVGSPGAGVETARELRVPTGHVFVGASSRDPVSYLDWFGADPTHERFGAVRFRAESVTRNPWLLDLADHTKYFEPGSESLTNVASIVVGDHAAVRVADYRREAWLLPDGIGTDPEADRVLTGRR